MNLFYYSLKNYESTSYIEGLRDSDCNSCSNLFFNESHFTDGIFSFFDKNTIKNIIVFSRDLALNRPLQKVIYQNKDIHLTILVNNSIQKQEMNLILDLKKHHFINIISTVDKNITNSNEKNFRLFYIPFGFNSKKIFRKEKKYDIYFRNSKSEKFLNHRDIQKIIHKYFIRVFDDKIDTPFYLGKIDGEEENILPYYEKCLLLDNGYLSHHFFDAISYGNLPVYAYPPNIEEIKTLMIDEKINFSDYFDIIYSFLQRNTYSKRLEDILNIL
ncbi:MAG: hypothetical protein SNJ64_01575 [Endomicrobiia bacterium]